MTELVILCIVNAHIYILLNFLALLVETLLSCCNLFHSLISYRALVDDLSLFDLVCIPPDIMPTFLDCSAPPVGPPSYPS